MKFFFKLILFFLVFSFLYGQTIEELYNKKDYKSLVKLETTADKLSPEELYMIGYAFFQLENDAKAIEFYEKAIVKGLNDGAVHFYKGLALR